MKEIRILTGKGFGLHLPESSFHIGLDWNPDVIVTQSTSQDYGPWHVGHTSTNYSPNPTYRRDMEKILVACGERRIPFIMSAGWMMTGADWELEFTLRMMDEICREKSLKFHIAVISGEISKDYLLEKLAKGEKMRRAVDTPRLPEFLIPDIVQRSTRILSQMGPEPIVKALDSDIDGVVTGRSLDLGLFMAMPLKKGFNKGLATHLAKILECGSLACEHHTGDLLFGILRKDHFLVRPPNPDLRCTPMSVTRQAFYERENPFMEKNPGGYLDISDAKLEQYDERTVKVSGSRWVPMKYAVKIEGVESIGFRSISIQGTRDPIMIKHIDEVLHNVRETVKAKIGAAGITEDQYKILFHVYGRNGVMGKSEPQKVITSHELGIVIDAVADTQEIADRVVGFAASITSWRSPYVKGWRPPDHTCLHACTPFSHHVISMGEDYKWSIWHLLDLEDPREPFRMTFRELGE